jgi:hypothetical protein
MRRALAPLAIAACCALLLVAAGCESSSTEPDRTITYSGTITKDHPVQDVLTMKGTGNVRASLVSLTQLSADGTSGPASLGLVMGIGSPAATCVPNGNFLFAGPSTFVSIGLDKGSYCLRFVESGVLPEGVSLQYTVALEISD